MTEVTRASQPPPAPLTASSSLVAVEGLVMGLLAVLEAASTSGDRLMVGVTTTVFFACSCLALLLCAYGLQRVSSWARGPVLLAQLIGLGVAWELRDTVWLAVMLVLVAALALAGVVHPASMAALEERR